MAAGWRDEHMKLEKEIKLKSLVVYRSPAIIVMLFKRTF
jgi:hypothetical protein